MPNFMSMKLVTNTGMVSMPVPPRESVSSAFTFSCRICHNGDGSSHTQGLHEPRPRPTPPWTAWRRTWKIRLTIMRVGMILALLRPATPTKRRHDLGMMDKYALRPSLPAHGSVHG